MSDEALRRRIDGFSAAERRVFEAFQALGMSEASAAAAVPCGTRDPLDRLVESFERLGLSESAARSAAIGPAGIEDQARRTLGEAGAQLSSATSERAVLVEALRAEDVEERAASRLAESLLAPGRPAPGRIRALGEIARVFEQAGAPLRESIEKAQRVLDRYGAGIRALAATAKRPVHQTTLDEAQKLRRFLAGGGR